MVHFTAEEEKLKDHLYRTGIVCENVFRMPGGGVQVDYHTKESWDTYKRRAPEIRRAFAFRILRPSFKEAFEEMLFESGMHKLAELNLV